MDTISIANIALVAGSILILTNISNIFYFLNRRAKSKNINELKHQPAAVSQFLRTRLQPRPHVMRTSHQRHQRPMQLPKSTHKQDQFTEDLRENSLPLVVEVPFCRINLDYHTIHLLDYIADKGCVFSFVSLLFLIISFFLKYVLDLFNSNFSVLFSTLGLLFSICAQLSLFIVTFVILFRVYLWWCAGSIIRKLFIFVILFFTFPLAYFVLNFHLKQLIDFQNIFIVVFRDFMWGSALITRKIVWGDDYSSHWLFLGELVDWENRISPTKLFFNQIT